jgi:hypothetical protein
MKKYGIVLINLTLVENLMNIKPLATVRINALAEMHIV